MINTTLDISITPVKEFLDSVDTVLNSNTFILTFNIIDVSLIKSFEFFLKSNDFITQIIDQDKDRNWHNMHYFDGVDNTSKIRPGNLINENIELELSLPIVDKREYLIAMLTGDTSVGSFCSFYRNQKERNEAETIVDNFVSYLAKSGIWHLFVLQPNFLKDNAHEYSKEGEIKYFDGDYGNDSATIIQCQNKGFLLLINGTD